MEQQNVEYAGFWVRVGASLIDTLWLMAVVVPLLLVFYGTNYYTDTDGPFIKGPADILISWVFPIVAVIAFWFYKQATPGKMVLSLKIVDAETGGPLTMGQTVGRYAAYYLSMLPLCLGFFWVAFDPKKQGWHDKLAGTVVIRRKNTVEPVTFKSAS
jgi:uncharacterized RDD family membrane protein YckC